MRPSLLFVTTLCAALVYADGSDGSEDTCGSALSFQCPYLSDVCNETVYVADCLNCDGYHSTDTIDDVCFDRKLLNAKDNPNPSYLWRDIVGIIVWFVAAGVATACGVGGGGIYVPLGILLLGFAPKPSSGLSQASIFGASLGGLGLNLRNKHPFTTKISGGHVASVPFNKHQVSTESVQYFARPLIDFDMALFLAPMEMAGAVLGVVIQKILPNWLYLLLAAVILSYTAYKTYGKFKDTHEKEVAAREAAQEQEQTPQNGSLEELLPKDDMDTTTEKNDVLTLDQISEAPKNTDHHQETVGEESSSEYSTEHSGTTDAEKVERRQHWLEKDSRQFPREKLLGLLVLWMGLLLLTFLKGGKGVESIIGITCASPWYAVLVVIQFGWTLGISAFFGYRLLKQTEDKVACDYPFHPQDVHWDFQKVCFYAFFTFLAGVVAGLIGVGGGMVLGPLMLVMGINPRVSTATTATMIVLTSSSVAVLFVTAGLVPWQYAACFFSVCLVGAYVGKTKIDAYVKKTGRASILILLLSIIIALATLGCVVIVVTRLAAANWCFAGFNKFCTVSEDHPEGDLCPVDRMLFGRPFLPN